MSQENPLEDEMTTHTSILAWKIPWAEEPGGLQSMGLQRNRHDLATEQQQKQQPASPTKFVIQDCSNKLPRTVPITDWETRARSRVFVLLWNP